MNVLGVKTVLTLFCSFFDRASFVSVTTSKEIHISPVL